MIEPSWLKTAARRSAEHAWLLGHVFEQYRSFERQSPEDLASRLGCSLETLAWVALCRRPDEDRFAEDLSSIAERFQVDPDGLAEIIRHVESLDVLAESQSEGNGGEEALLMAAHDREPEDDGADS